MSCSINVQGLCSRKGDIPISSGDAYSSFASTAQLPLDPVTNNALPGYALMSNSAATSRNGVNWTYTGTGQNIKQYEFPTNCPLPFPLPSEETADIVQITRESVMVGTAGLVDIAMPVLGTQGLIPTHSLPSLCDTINQVVFFFDNANAAINVYNVNSETWIIGWLRAVPSASFRWRAAALLTDDLVKLTAPTYTAPYNAKGLFFSAASSIFTNQQRQQTVSIQQSGVYFVPYATTGTGISPCAIANLISAYDSSSDISVSAIRPVDQNKTGYIEGNNTVNVTEVVAAVAVGNDSILTDNLYGWWGFLARVSDGVLPPTLAYTLVNPDLSLIALKADFYFYQTFGDPTGFIQTISYDGKWLFFLGGNFSYIRFQNNPIQRNINGGTQISAVAMEFYYPAVPGAITAANYYFIGSNGTSAAGTLRDWTGRVTQSNYTPDGYFTYGGNFITPPSPYITATQIGNNTPTAATVAVTQTNSQNQTSLPRRILPVPQSVKGGTITTAIYGTTNVINWPAGLNTTNQGFCINFVPDDGDVKQGSFTTSFIGGNFLNPTSYRNSSVHFFQTQQTLNASQFWWSFLSFYVQTTVSSAVTANVYMYPATLTTGVGPTAPIQYQVNCQLTAGYNSIPILGGGATLLNIGVPNNGGDMYNSNRVTQTVGVASLPNTNEVWYVLIIFTIPGTATPANVSIGENAGNGNINAGCFVLEGYPNTNLGTNGGPGRFSAVALLNGNATQATAGISRVVTYNNVNLQVPLNTVSYQSTVIPINIQFAFSWVGINPDLAVNISISEDRQGDFKYSALNNARIPTVVYEIPVLSTATGQQPAFSLYSNSRYEIYKTSWANSDAISLGLYTNFQEISDMKYVFKADGANVNGIINSESCAFTSIARTTLVLNTYNDATNTAVDFTAVNIGDILTVRDLAFAPDIYNAYLITAAVVISAVNFTASFTVSLQSGTLPLAATTDSLISIVLSRNPTQTPFVLKEAFGNYVIGNGSSPTTLRDVYLSSFSGTGKTYRYLPNYQNNFVSFRGFVLVGGETADDTFAVNTALFNSNASSILLTKAKTGDDWVLSRAVGNVGWNTQNA